jgi:hypothetical protein
MLHYHSFSTHGKDDAIKAIVTNEEEAAKQYPAVKTILREAMTDVLLRMHELQQKEQSALRADPLSVLALHAPSSTSIAASMDIFASSSVQLKQQKRALSENEAANNSKKLRKENMWNISGTHSDTDMQGDARRHSSIIQKDLMRQVSSESKVDPNEYLYPTGPPCSQCSSAETLVKHDSSMASMSGTRNEIWGNKDNEGGHSKSTILCKACGFEKIEIS